VSPADALDAVCSHPVVTF